MTHPSPSATLCELRAIADDPNESEKRREGAEFILRMAARSEEVGALLADARRLADDPVVGPDRQDTVRKVLGMVDKAREVAALWGGDEHAEMRTVSIRTAEGVEEYPYDYGLEQGAVIDGLDELCWAVGVPLEKTLSPNTK